MRAASVVLSVRLEALLRVEILEVGILSECA
jgi:hypothetical protein